MRFISFLVLAFHSLSLWAAIDLGKVESDLNGAGLECEVHGASADNQLYVLTVRDSDFFTHLEFPLTSKSPSVLQLLPTLHRHDRVRVRGSFLKNHAPIPHIDALEVTVIKKFQDGQTVPGYEYGASVPEELEGKSVLTAKVHAVAGEGKILVVEYKDVVIPVVVRDPKWTKDLFRSDKIEIHYVLRKNPPEPTHVMLDPQAATPLTVLESVQTWHGKPASVEGSLIMFPKSPQVIFNVFALQVPDPAGFTREFTLLNFEKDVFTAIREKLQALWDLNSQDVENARNKYINRKLRLRATGTFNVVDPGQANPQIILSGPESLSVVP